VAFARREMIDDKTGIRWFTELFDQAFWRVYIEF
jgi:hypothetical protein